MFDFKELKLGGAILGIKMKGIGKGVPIEFFNSEPAWFRITPSQGRQENFSLCK